MPHSNAMHPEISEENKLVRIRWILGLLDHILITTTPKYKCLFDCVYIEEKWFYLSRKSQRVYLAKNEPKPYRSGKSSKFIPKVMFMGCVARPRWSDRGQCIFDGKIEIFPFMEIVLAQRSSKNRKKGESETKPTQSVNKQATRNMLIHKTYRQSKQSGQMRDQR